MSFISSGGNSFSTAFALTGNIGLYVTDSGSDSNGARTESAGNLISKPFLTINGALGYLPVDRSLSGYTATIHYTRSVAQSVTASGFKNGSLVLDGAILNTSSFISCDNLSLTNIEGVGQLTINDSTSVITGNVHDNGCFLFNGGRSNIQISASACASTALKAQYMAYIGYSVVANNCLATPVDFLAVQSSELVGAGLTGTNAAATRGVRLAGGGKHVLTGATLTSETDYVLDLDGYAIKWSELSIENYTNSSTYAFWADNLWVLLGRFRILNNSSLDYDDLIFRDGQYGRTFKAYGLNRPLDPAYQEIVSASSGLQADATPVGLQQTLVVSGILNSSIRLLNTLDNNAASLGGGANGTIFNRTGSIIRLYPPIGKTLYLNGSSLGTNTFTTMANGTSLVWLCDNNGDYNLR